MKTQTLDALPLPAAAPSPTEHPGRLRRHFSSPRIDPLDDVRWERRDSAIRSVDGSTVFEQKNVEVPADWSQMATDVVASKYFRGALGTPEREDSVRQLVERVVGRIAAKALEGGWVEDADEANVLRDELAWLVVHQRASFNSPVWFNVGVEDAPQCSACFINAVDDTLDSILELAATEARLFKHGSGSGSNLSGLRGSHEPLSGGGTASGPVSFMRGLDAFAGVIKSGGKTRRAAKMVVLDVDHPDILEFVRAKREEEKKARALVEAGWDASFVEPGNAAAAVFFQNANHTVRVTDAFLEAVESDGPHETRAVVDGRVLERLEAREVLREIASASWDCGDPGLQYDGTIQRWHTCPEAGRIAASNPCSEFLFLDDSACNLASLDLLSFDDPDTGFDSGAFRHAAEVLLTAQDVLVDLSGYPTERIRAHSLRFRPLGLGYANLGALLMARGLAYDSPEGRGLAGTVTALLTGAAYCRSTRLAERLGPFAAFDRHRDSVLRVVEEHRAALDSTPELELAPRDLARDALEVWNEVVERARRHGVRNAQVTALAPTGTIAFMMDCDTTGVEPELALVKTKKLVGGGTLRIANRTVARALRSLGYDEATVETLVESLSERGNPEVLEGLDPDHLPVFDCALRPPGGKRSIAHRGHLRMLGAIQPFVSGGISKTINLPADATVGDVENVFLEGWRLGLKAVSIYRDSSKSSQPLSTGDGPRSKTNEAPKPSGAAPKVRRARSAVRRRLPDERRSITHKFSIAAHEGYLTVGLYDDGQPGEIFLVMAKEGSTISGLMDAFATAISLALQYGVPLEALIEKFSHSRFEPSGFTGNPRVPMAKSIIDYIFRWLASKFLPIEQQLAAGVLSPVEPESPSASSAEPAPGDQMFHDDAPSCSACGAIMVRSGACYRCLSCGTTSSCG